MNPYSRSAVRCSVGALAEQAADLRAPGEEVRGLAPDDLEVLFLGDAGVAGLGELVELALDHLQRRVAEQPHDLERVLRQRHRHRADVEVVAEQHRDVAAPARVRGQPAAAGLGAVDDVVVDERGRVDELDDGRVEHRAIPGVAAEPGRQQQHGRPHALAAAHLDVLAHLRDELDARLEVTGELALDVRELVADRLEDLGETRNGRRGRIARESISPAGSPSKNLPESDHRFRRGVNARRAEQRVEVARDERAHGLDRDAARRRRRPVVVSATHAGSLRLPRCGTGARKGASVSTSTRSSGTNAATSRRVLAFGKVTMPESEMKNPRSSARRASSTVPLKQCMTPRRRPVAGLADHRRTCRRSPRRV